MKKSWSSSYIFCPTFLILSVVCNKLEPLLHCYFQKLTISVFVENSFTEEQSQNNVKQNILFLHYINSSHLVITIKASFSFSFNNFPISFPYSLNLELYYHKFTSYYHKLVACSFLHKDKYAAEFRK